MVPVTRFLRRFLRPVADPAREREIPFPAGPRGAGVATLYVPAKPEPRGAAWILLHGVTVWGRHHEAVRRMARALAAAGHWALVPEVPSWTALRVTPEDAAPTLEAARRALEEAARLDGARVGVMGFSIAATWALAAVADASTTGIRVVAGFGAYGDFRRTVAAMITGEHEWQGRQYRYTPDAYGRWIVGAASLPLLPGVEYGARADRRAAAVRLRYLARTAGRNGAAAFAPVYDPLIARCRDALAPGVRSAWDLLAPPSTAPLPDARSGRALAGVLVDAALGARPELELGQLDGLRVRVVLVHGRADTLVPFTETLRLAGKLPAGIPRTVVITRLVGHTKTGEARRPRNPVALSHEAWRFARAMAQLLASV